MPNWCSFDACIYGEKREVEAFRTRCEHAIESGKATNNWDTYELCIQHGMTKDEINSPNFGYIGGSIDDLGDVTDEYEGRSFVMVHMTTRWAPMIAGFESLLKNYISLEGVYMAEEPGMGIYVNTDVNGRYFSSRYYIDDWDVGNEWFDNIDQVKKYIKDAYNKTLSEVKLAELERSHYIHIKTGKDKGFMLYKYSIN